MRKKLLSILLLVVLTICITACGSNSKLNDIAKNINNSETAKTYKEYGYELKATATKDTLTITSKMEDSKTTVSFKLSGDILSNEKLSNEELMLALLLIDGVGQAHGYKEGQLSQNMNAFTEEYTKYTLDKEGLELIVGDNSTSVKINISKKIPLIDMSNFYLKESDFDMISEFVSDNKNGNQSGKSGNIAYDIFLGDEESTITIGQDEKLGDSAYKSIVSALKVMYGEDIAKHFQEIYPNFVDGKKTVEAFTIEKDYEPEDKDNSVFKDTEVVLITIDNKKIK